MYITCHKHIIKLLTVAVALSNPLAPVSAAVYTSGHGDIGVEYDAGNFEPHWHMGTGAVVDGSPLIAGEEYAPDDLVAEVSASRNSPTGLSASLGVADGTLIYVMGSATYQPNPACMTLS